MLQTMIRLLYQTQLWILADTCRWKPLNCCASQWKNNSYRRGDVAEALAYRMMPLLT